MNVTIKTEGKTYYRISEKNLIHAYNEGKNILWIFKSDYGLDKIIFSKRSEFGDIIIEHIKFFIEMKEKFNIPFSSKNFYFVQL